MTADITREEFERRVGFLEREVEGEKMVTRHILEHSRRNTDDLAAVKVGLKENSNDLAALKVGLKVGLKDLTAKVDAVGAKVDGLIQSLPKIVGDVMRDVLKGRADMT